LPGIALTPLNGSGHAGRQRLLSRQFVIVFCRAVLAIEIVAFIFFAAGTHGLIVPLQKPTSTDFVSFYAAGTLANSGTPFLAYDQAAHHIAEEHASQPGIIYNFFTIRRPFCCSVRYWRVCRIFRHLSHLRS
jgi:hypothetical protein